jgi:hypothetical protein
VAGSIDESARIFSSRERPLAELLAAEGRNVKARREPSPQTRGVRNADAEVDGVVTEFKKPDPGATENTVVGRVQESLRRQGQARYIIIDARGSGLTSADASLAYRRLLGVGRGRLDSLRVVGDGFDTTFTGFL